MYIHVHVRLYVKQTTYFDAISDYRHHFSTEEKYPQQETAIEEEMAKVGVSTDDVKLQVHTQCTANDTTTATHRVSSDSLMLRTHLRCKAARC